MMYVVSTDYEQFAFETEEELNDFMENAILPLDYRVEKIESSPMCERMALDTRWRLM